MDLTDVVSCNGYSVISRITISVVRKDFFEEDDQNNIHNEVKRKIARFNRLFC